MQISCSDIFLSKVRKVLQFSTRSSDDQMNKSYLG